MAKILDDDIVDFIVGVWLNDKSADYDYGENRARDGRPPKKGSRWATPREMAKALMNEKGITYRQGDGTKHNQREER